MSDASWKDDLKKYFDNVRILERAKAETLESFNQFCEFIAEPAFESLAEELSIYRVRTIVRKEKNRFIHVQLSFPGSKTDNFHYQIVLPKNSFELRLLLVVKGRKSPTASLEEKEEAFMKDKNPRVIMKLDKDALIEDVITRYRDFNFAALTSTSV